MASANKCLFPDCNNQTLTGMCWRHQGKSIPIGDSPASVGITTPKLALNFDNRLVSAEPGGPIDAEQYRVIEMSYAAISLSSKTVGKALEDLSDDSKTMSSHDQEIMKVNHLAPFIGASMRMSDLIGELRTKQSLSDSGEVVITEEQTARLVKSHNEMEDLQSRIQGVKRITNPKHHPELDKYSRALSRAQSKLNIEVLDDITG